MFGGRRAAREPSRHYKAASSGFNDSIQDLPGTNHPDRDHRTMCRIEDHDSNETNHSKPKSPLNDSPIGSLGYLTLGCSGRAGQNCILYSIS